MHSNSYIKTIIILLAFVVVATLVVRYLLWLGVGNIRRDPNRVLTDQSFEYLSISAIHSSSIAVLKTSTSPLGKGYIEYDEDAKDNDSKHCMTENNARDVIKALRPVTLIEKKVELVPEEIDCVFYCWTARHLWFYIDVKQEYLRFYINGNLYQGGESEKFISLINNIWIEHGGANNHPVKLINKNGTINL